MYPFILFDNKIQKLYSAADNGPYHWGLPNRFNFCMKIRQTVLFEKNPDTDLETRLYWKWPHKGPNQKKKQPLLENEVNVIHNVISEWHRFSQVVNNRIIPNISLDICFWEKINVNNNLIHAAWFNFWCRMYDHKKQRKSNENFNGKQWSYLR